MAHDPDTPYPEAIAYPHGLDPEWPDGPPTVVIRERGCDLELRFDEFSGDASLLELRLKPHAGAKLDPVKARQLFPQLDLYLQLARAGMKWDAETIQATAEALRRVGRPGRGLSDDFFRLIATQFKAHIAAGEKHPTKALAETHHATISAASRWVSGARSRGYLTERKTKRGVA
jgi:hypothetical protein